MTDEEYDQRLGAIEELALRFPGAELTEQNIKSYVWSLSDLSQIVLRAAIERCVATAKFFPSVAEIRENAEAVSTAPTSGGKHPDSCKCFGTGMYVPDERDDAGYKLPARRCDQIAAPSEVDDVSMF